MTSIRLRRRPKPRRDEERPTAQANTDSKPKSTSQSDPTRRIKSGVHSPTQSTEKGNPQEEATTPRETGGVAGPSLRARSLGEQSFDLLQLSLKHPLYVVALLVNLTGDLRLERRNLGV